MKIAQVLWMGHEAMSAALELLEVAEDFHCRHQDGNPISWAQNLIRPAANAKQARDFSKLQAAAEAALGSQHSLQLDSACLEKDEQQGPESISVRALTLDEAGQQVPRLPREQLSAAVGPEHATSAALLVDGAHVIHPTRYLAYAPLLC